MPEIRTLRSRGARGIVEAHGEVMFAPGGVVNNWFGRFTANAIAATVRHAPTNRRHRWAHYGKPLKGTIRGSTGKRRGVGKPGLFHLYAAVGSTAPYSLYVDQGTGIYGGNGPYQGKILPPWYPGNANLYEHTWMPPHRSGREGARRLGTVTIKGQKGQEFFDAGLRDAFRKMRMRSVRIPGEGASGMTGVLNSAPASLLGFLGNTRADAGFVAQLEQWREWRDAAFRNGDFVGKGGTVRGQAAMNDRQTARRNADSRRVIAERRRAKEREAKEIRKREREAKANKAPSYAAQKESFRRKAVKRAAELRGTLTYLPDADGRFRAAIVYYERGARKVKTLERPIKQ